MQWNTFIFMKLVVRDRVMQISDILNIESLALALKSLALLTSLASSAGPYWEFVNKLQITPDGRVNQYYV